MTDLDELKRLAQAVPKKDGVDVVSRGNDTQHVHAVGAFIRAATPDVVLALVERVERAEASRDDEVGGLERHILFLQSLLGAEKEERDALRERVERAEADNAALLNALTRVYEHGATKYDAEAEALLDAEHPGAAFLERVSRLEALLRKHARRVPCPACGCIGSRTCATCDHGEREHFHPEVAAALEGK